MIMNAFPFLTRANISLDRMETFEKEMNSYLGKSDGYGEPMPEEAISSIRFENITYSYHDERLKRKFTLGPINLTIQRGETVFVVGENGSGKSTFMLLLAGLIQPEGGRIYVNECPVLPQNYPSYSDKLSAIFTDAYLFNEHYDDFNINASAGPWREYLEMLRMTDVVRFDDETQRATSKLSKGQQKRLMMMYALMENKQVFLLDEWAAEQDPAFRAYFYRQLLPLLKSMGKTVVAVTHDDHYFEYADRVVTFHDGYIAKDVYARQSTLVATEG
jgi:ABC-type siderophore export system fused ATPase/permease subunit